MEKLIYSSEEHIPLFKLICNSQGERFIQYRHPRTKICSEAKASSLVIHLIEKESDIRHAGETIIRTPDGVVPIGIMTMSEAGICSIEVLHKRKKKEDIRESIPLIEYATLLLEA